VAALWHAIERLCRLDRPDPIAAWETHLSQPAARTNQLNAKQYKALKYSGPGTSLTIGLPAGHIWVSANYSHVKWGNIDQFGLAAAGILTDSDWVDGNLFWEVTPAVRFGAEYAYFQQTRGDNQKPKNHRFQLSSWFIF